MPCMTTVFSKLGTIGRPCSNHSAVSGRLIMGRQCIQRMIASAQFSLWLCSRSVTDLPPMQGRGRSAQYNVRLRIVKHSSRNRTQQLHTASCLAQHLYEVRKALATISLHRPSSRHRMSWLTLNTNTQCVLLTTVHQKRNSPKQRVRGLGAAFS